MPAVARMGVVAPVTAEKKNQTLPEIPRFTNIERNVSIPEVDNVDTRLLWRILTELDPDLATLQLRSTDNKGRGKKNFLDNLMIHRFGTFNFS
jgi:hypothetical protein